MVRHVEAGGRGFDVRPVKVGDLPAFLTAVEPVARELADGDILAALTRHADGVIEVVSIGAGCEREWLDEQALDVLMELATVVVEVNTDFFIQRLLPRIESAVQRLEAAMRTGGVAGSSNSSAPDSATVT